mgnify:CR=1 FL=1
MPSAERVYEFCIKHRAYANTAPYPFDCADLWRCPNPYCNSHRPEYPNGHCDARPRAYRHRKRQYPADSPS